MKSEKSWAESKYVYRKGRLRASRNTSEVSIGSRMIGDLVAGFYDEHARHHASGRLVDLGCGTVPLFSTYREHVLNVSCVDWAAPANGEDHLDVTCDLSKPLPFNDAEFNTIILSDVLEHIGDPAMLWSEMARILAPGGKLLLNTPFIYCLHEQPHDYYRFSSHALRRYAGMNDFKVIYLEPLGGTPEVLADIVSKHLQFVPFLGSVLARMLQGITYWFVRTAPGASLSRRTAEAFPLAYAMIVERICEDDN